MWMMLWNWIFGASVISVDPSMGQEHSLFEYHLEFIQESQSLQSIQKQGKVFLVVNIATGCGLHQQLQELENLYQKYRSQGLVVIGVPSADFFNQEKRDGTELAHYCSLEYGVDYPLTRKIHVAQDPVHPLFQWLALIQKPQWNYQKYLFNSQGYCVAVAAPVVSPQKLEPQIQLLLSSL